MTESSVRKAAAFLTTLPEPAVAALSAQLSPADWQSLQAARAAASNLVPDERTSAVADFLIALSEHAPPTSLAACERAEPAQLAALLSEEHPQTIAVVLARIAPARAAEALSHLPVTTRAEVARRMAGLETIEEGTLHDVAEILDERLAELPQTRFATIDGVAALGDILQSLDRDAERQLIHSLADDDTALAEAVSAQVFQIEDVLDWSRAAAQLLLASIETPPLAVVLRQASSENRRKILELLPGQMAERLRQAVAHLGEVPPAIFTQARRTIVDTLRQLQRAGKINPEPLPPSPRLVA